MASLVADYGTDSENDSDLEISEASANSKGSLNSSHEASVDQMSNFFSQEGDEDDEEDSDSEDEEETDETEAVSSEPVKKLPNPLARGHSSSTYIPKPCSFKAPKVRQASSSSVFANQYQKAEADKWSVLEQHVKMTTTEQPGGSKKKICKSFKKGKCRYGKKCSFMHSKDLVVIQKSPDLVDEEGSAPPPNKHGYYGQRGNRQRISPDREDDDSYMGQAKRKFRAKVNDTLRPSKKAMTALDHQREHERPWTVQD